MKELTDIALNTAKLKGATYADIRIIDIRNESLVVRNETIKGANTSSSLGFGVRVIAGGAWGFACSNNVTKEEVRVVTAKAVAIARASATLKENNVLLSPAKARQAKWMTPYVVDPFTVPIEQKLKLLFDINKVLRKKKEIVSATSSMNFARERQWLATTDGTFIDQTITRSGAGYGVTAVGNGDVQSRSFPASHGGLYKTMGYEMIAGTKLVENADRIRDEAIALLKAQPCPGGKKDIIVGGSQMALQIHESVGHATELDRVLGMEESFAGRSFATPEKYRKFRYGSDIVNLVADSTIPTGLATIGFDDDGIPAQRWDIVKNGRFTGYMTSREFAPQIGEESRGCNRAEGWNNIPIVRIANLSLMPGNRQLKELIADTKDGIYMDNNKMWSIDQMRLNFQFTCEIGWEIKNGRRGKMIKNPTYQGITPEFWNSCDAICDEDHWVLWGVPNCGKGQPMQTAEMSHGAAPSRFRKITVGIK
ncbi:MAG: peptidase C69 [Planctomycetes bacterium RBG_16_59_8]|nr:MAG: peptidase C69 [Planctomycetes bacterium RBG_16_59_8]